MQTDLMNDPDRPSDEQSDASRSEPQDGAARKPFVRPELRHEADLIDDTATTAFS